MEPLSSHTDVVRAQGIQNEDAGTAEESLEQDNVLIGEVEPLVLLEAAWSEHADLSEQLWMDMVCEELFANGRRAYRHRCFVCQEGLARLLNALTDNYFFLHIGAHGTRGELTVCDPDPKQEHDDQAHVDSSELAQMIAKVNIGPRSIRGVFIGACSYFADDSEEVARALFADHLVDDPESGDDSPKIVKCELHWAAGFAREVAWGDGAIVAAAFWRQVILQRWNELGRRTFVRPGSDAEYLEKAVAVLHAQMEGLLKHVELCVYRNRNGTPVPVLVRGELADNTG